MDSKYGGPESEYESRLERIKEDKAYRREIVKLLAIFGFGSLSGTVAFSGEAGGYEGPEYRELEEEDTQEVVEEFFPEESNTADEFGF